MENTSSFGQAGGAGGVSMWDAFHCTESNWSRLKSYTEFEYDATRIDNPGVTHDCVAGNPRCWSKLRSASES